MVKFMHQFVWTKECPDRQYNIMSECVCECFGVCLSMSVSVYVSGGDSHLVHTLRKLIILTKASRLYLSHLGT